MWIVSRHRENSLSLTALVIDIDSPSTAPAHDHAAKGFSFSEIFLGVKVLCANSACLFELNEILSHEEMPNVMRGKAYWTFGTQRCVVPIPMPVKVLGRVGRLPLCEEQWFMGTDVCKSRSRVRIMQRTHLLNVHVEGLLNLGVVCKVDRFDLASIAAFVYHLRLADCPPRLVATHSHEGDLMNPGAGRLQ